MKKLNKKGFTLVELLAVIAILAILMLLVMPNILNMFKEGKKSSFVTQAQSIYKAAEQKFISESIKTPGSYTFTNATSTATNKATLDINGSSEVKYCVKVNTEGGITKLEVSDSAYILSVGDGSSTISIDAISAKTSGEYSNLHVIGEKITPSGSETYAPISNCN